MNNPSDHEYAPTAGRIKRQVQGREHRFALVCPPGFEDICLNEARTLDLVLAEGSLPGPVLEWTGRLDDLYRAALYLRTTSRILVRLAEFRAGAEELFRHGAGFAWELWLPPGCTLRIDAHVSRSRISHEGMTAQTVFEAIARRFQLAGLDAPVLAGSRPAALDAASDDDEAEPDAPTAQTVQRLIVRLDDNRASLSLDATGEHLHRRGWRTTQGAAPIRENLAAGLLAWAGWPHRSGALVDGMCGSGTFAVEALAAARGWPNGGHADRDFAFSHWPSFLPARLSWHRRQGLSLIASAPPPAIISNELDAATLGLARANGLRFDPACAAAIDWRQGDFFLLEPAGLKTEAAPGLLVLNPPYGLRLSDDSGSLYPRLCRHLAERWAAWDILLLGLPDTRLDPLKTRLKAGRTFRHGGLRLAAWLFSAVR